VYRFSSLLKQKIKRQKLRCLLLLPEKEKYFLFYEVIIWEKNLKRATIHYSHPPIRVLTCLHCRGEKGKP
jgi:hypothetical protein